MKDPAIFLFRLGLYVLALGPILALLSLFS